MRRLLYFVLCLALFHFACSRGGRHSNKQASRFLKAHHRRRQASASASSAFGLWPSVFNLATKASIASNATCGERSRQEFCRLAENGKGRCGVCDGASPDPAKRHPVAYAIDGTSKWWQSPPIHYGAQYEYVTVTLDLGQVYQIAYVILKAANSPRPGTWVLERSVDGDAFLPWQYFARSDRECWERFGIPAAKGRPRYYTDSEVICTSFYSKLTPLENGEVHASLVQGRPGANESSPELLEFTKARYVRLRLMGLRGAQEPVPRWLAQDIFRDKRLFYSIRDISVGGQCMCNGHAESCRHNVASGHPECECAHHTCGPNCDRCCPLYNEREWGPGTSRDARPCLPCECNGHATSCHYDERRGGGVCDNCTDFTAGPNCELCAAGHYRPEGVATVAPRPCRPCPCDPVGTASCEQYGAAAGRCTCAAGYAGERCDRCAPGHRGWPRCEPCPCDAKGVATSDGCEGECTCKANVEGKYCDRCKPGYFALRSDLQDGCLTCYCSGVTTLCESAIIKSKKITSLHEWLMSDLRVRHVVKPSWNGQSVFSLGGYVEAQSARSFYWLAPGDYLGNRLEAYNGELHFKVQWVVMRGDTSGEPTRGPNAILVGRNGMRIAHGDDAFDRSTMEFTIKLAEPGWYHVPADLEDFAGGAYHGPPVTRGEYLDILSDVAHLLLRSTFHTDQIEALLEEASITYEEGADEGYGSVEECSCPSGYGGLSCEKCSYGYVRVVSNSTLREGGGAGYCKKCDCNRHSRTCNPDSGECSCEHNTVGEKCERCAPGYYGNPIRSTPDDCKRCACPLETPSNNFSPSCQLDFLDPDLGGYVCTQCPRGYTGDHCEVCDDGFYGDPQEIGNSCQPCDCNGGPCDRKTGQCLSCKGNTEGWKCDRCKPEHYGEPSRHNCRSCECDPLGSSSRQCDNVTGQCECRPRFTGRSCDRCEVGYGNVTASCVACTCDPVGSRSELCDTHDGTCDCKPGVEGFRCDACQNLFYGFSEEGCTPCNCDPIGSKFLMCNVTTGDCVCKPHFIGTTCDTCEDNFWKRDRHCVPCACNPNGTVDGVPCDKSTGRCSCSAGVGGDKCDTCLDHHYGDLLVGCKRCDPCDLKGHVCHPETGKCVCPPLTRGDECGECEEDSWGFEPGVGCKACGCSTEGSSTSRCDPLDGTCTCRAGFEGGKCDRCAVGHHGYPTCGSCGCDADGTVDADCPTGGRCRCSEEGICRCKENVRGAKCDACASDSYGLSKENPEGCTKCFCFGRSSRCSAARQRWDKVRLEKTIEEDNSVDEVDDVLMLPVRFLGDLTGSYGGYLGVVVPGGSFRAYLRGNGVQIRRAGVNEVRLVENGWVVDALGEGFPRGCRDSLDRACFMAVLQYVEGIRVEAQGRINEVLLDRASPGEYPTGGSVERCECPEGYSGLSCQDPAEGYYRAFPEVGEEIGSWVDVVIGVARRCECNGKSTRCDPESGKCKNCTENTTGDHCELCDVGYYWNKLGDKCAPCLCPSAEHNNARNCSPVGDGFVCNCKKGYHGESCDKCQPGFYDKDPSEKITECEPCGCNPHGTVSGDEASCDASGRCTCADGFRGTKCDRCARPREVIVDGICSPCDECSQLLFDELESLEKSLDDVYALFEHGVAPPWKSLTDKLDRHRLLSAEFERVRSKTDRLLEDADVGGLETRADRLGEAVKQFDALADENLSTIDGLYDNSSLIVRESDRLGKKLSSLVGDLEGFGREELSVDEALRRAQAIRSGILEASDRMRRLGDDDDVHAFCSDVARRVHHLYHRNSTSVPDLDDFRRKLNELIDVTARVDSAARLAEGLNSRNAEELQRLRARVEEARRLGDSAMLDVGDVVGKIEAIDDVATRLREVYDDLKKISESGEYKELEERTKRQMEAGPEVEELYLRAIEHVQELERKVDEYQSMFNFTKDEWRKINASGAYESIIAGVNDARRDAAAAQRNLVDAAKIVDPAHSDRLIDKTNLAHAYSDRLRQRINNFNDISKDFNRVKHELEDLKYSILEDGKSNNDLTQVLHRIESEITSQADRVLLVEEAIANGSAVSDEMTDLAKNVSDLDFDRRHLFFKEYQNFLNLTTAEEINNLTNKLKYARRKLQDLNISTTNLDTIRTFNGRDVQSKIDELRNRVTYARQVADTVNVAMTLSDCLMTYKLQKPEFFRSFSVTYKCKSDCNVFKWTKAAGETFHLYVEEGRTRLEVNGKEATLDEGGAKGDSERTVKFQKMGSHLRVLLDGLEVRTERISNAFIMMDPEDRLQSGGLTDATPGSYLVKMALNDKNLGLWNFRKTEGRCKGQKRDRSDVPNATLMTYYTGEGYSVYGTNLGSSALNPQQLSWTFDLSTFDEDALVYLAVTEKCSQYIALYLEGGRAKFSVRHDAAHSMLQAPAAKLNDGRNYKLQVTLSYDKSKRRQRYNLIVRSEDGAELANEADDLELPRTGVFKIRQAVRYLGGVPPTFPSGCVPFGVGPLLGFLKPQAPFTNETASYGVVHVDKKVLEFPNVRLLPVADSRLEVAWGGGDVNTLSFVARPSTASGLLFDFEDGSRVYLVERRVAVSIGGVEHVSSNVLVADEYNEVQVKFGKQKSLSVNDKKEEMPFGGKITVEDGFVIGGAGYAGGLRDIVINHESLSFNYSTVRGFSDVQIGREATTPSATAPAPSTRSLVPNLTNSMQNTERCAPAGTHQVDPDAIAYGDVADSWTHVRTDAWRRDYRLSFEFRTFYPNGLVLLASNQKLQNYVLLDLQEGKLRMTVKGKKKKVQITFGESKLNDGRWHSITIDRKKRKVTVGVDGEREKPVRVPKAAVRNEAYVGGIDPGSDYVKIKDLKDKLHQFRGCIRAFAVNDEGKLQAKGARHSNTGKCFPDVEEGAYFDGGAYAVYKDDYRPGRVLELSFEFRTSEQNGVLLSVSHGTRGLPAFSVELQNGAVTMSVDLGGVVSTVTNNLNSDFALCDDRWHNVTALYTNAELTVNVDGIRKSWVQSEEPPDDAERPGAPLYIGGLPGDALQGTLRTRESFRGCLRKLKIEDRPMDWSDMKELHNVSLNSCPSGDE